MTSTTTTKIINLSSTKCDGSLESQDRGDLESDDDYDDKDNNNDNNRDNNKNHKSLYQDNTEMILFG